MSGLRCTVPFEKGEALVAHASRVAACNGVGLVAFCRDVGIPLRGLVRGEREAVERLAELSGGEVDALATGAIGYVTHVLHRVRGQELHKLGLRRRSLVACPRCLVEDVAAGGLPPIELARARVAWNVRGLETCPVHHAALLEVEGDRNDEGGYDFSGRLAPHLGDLDRLADDAIERSPTGFETYLARRLDNGTGPDGLLEAMPFHAARLACLRLGILIAFDKRTWPHHLSTDQIREAEAAGFEAMRDGEPNLHHALDAFHSRVHAGRGCMEGPQAVLGTFWHWLAAVGDKPEYDALSSSVAEHAFENYPLPAGAKVLGRTLERRRWHSLRSASLEAGLSTNKVRTLLAGQGLLPDDEGRSDTLVVFDADLAMPVLMAKDETLHLPDVATLLGVTRDAIVRLVEDGLLGASTRSRARNLRFLQLELADVNHLVDRLFDGAEKVHEECGSTLGLAACANRLQFTRGDVLRLALDDRTLWRGRLVGREGVSALLLRPEDVEARLSPASGDVLDMIALARRLKVNSQAVAKLLQKHVIPSHVLPRQRFGRPQRVVKAPDVEAFVSEYASLGMLALETGRPIPRICDEIAIAGVMAALPVEELGVALYRRSELPDTADSIRTDQDRAPISSLDLTRALGVNARVVANSLDAPQDATSPQTEPVPPSSAMRKRGGETGTGPLEAPISRNPMAAREVPDVLTEIETRAAAEPDIDYVPDVGMDATVSVMSVQAICRRLGMTTRVVYRLISCGAIPLHSTSRTTCRRVARTVLRRDVDAFDAQFIGLGALARERASTIQATQVWLELRGVGAAFPMEVCEALVYRRADVPPGGPGLPDDPPLSTVDVARALQTTHVVASGLLVAGAIRSHLVTRPSLRTPHRIVLTSALRAFTDAYASLLMLASETGIRRHEVCLRLAAHGVEPAFSREEDGIQLYRRSEIASSRALEVSTPTAVAHKAMSRELGMDVRSVLAILHAGLIPSRPVSKPASGKPLRLVTREALDWFKEEFVTAGMLAKERGGSAPTLGRHLAASGVKPVLPGSARLAAVYRRRDLMSSNAPST
jgi:hypothetical protein